MARVLLQTVRGITRIARPALFRVLGGSRGSGALALCGDWGGVEEEGSPWMVVAVNPGVVLPFLGGYDRICIRFVRGRRLRFDAFIFREFVISAITIKKIRHAIDENVFVEKLFPDEVEALRSLPLPLNVLRKLWMRTQKRAGMAPVLYLLRIPPERSASTGERVT